jgi:hypothetical protein
MERDRTKDWRELCKAAATELDPAKLMDLIAELTKALDERDKKRRHVNGENPNENRGESRSLGSEPAIG